MVRKTIIGVLISMLTLASASAQEGGPDEQWLLAKYDVNGDQVISSNEVADKRKQAFVKMDFDQDGDVSFAEYEQLDQIRRTILLKARFDKLDANHDGRLTGAEYSSYLGSFDRLDQNRDGQLSQHEMTRKREIAKKDKNEADVCLLWVCVRKNMW